MNKRTKPTPSAGKKKAFCWRLHRMCDNCPFAESGPGRQLRDSLQPGRFAGIVRDILAGKFFYCHKTTRSTGDGSNLYCAGALQYQAARGVVSAYALLCKQFEGCQESKQEIFRRLRAIGRRTQ